MTVQELIEKLKTQPQDATVIMSTGDYPSTPRAVCSTTRFDGYITPGFGSQRYDIVVVISGGF